VLAQTGDPAQHSSVPSAQLAVAPSELCLVHSTSAMLSCPSDAPDAAIPEHRLNLAHTCKVKNAYQKATSVCSGPSNSGPTRYGPSIPSSNYPGLVNGSFDHC
jgi:hypothetical protein